MKVIATTNAKAWIDTLEPGTPQHHHAYAELGYLAQLPLAPITDTHPHLVRIRQARRHIIWRLSHPYHHRIAVRVLVWFPTPTEALIVGAGDKGDLGNIWYDHAVPQAELTIDHWIRSHP